MNKHIAKDIKRLESYIKAYIEKQGYPGVAVGIRGPEGPIFEKGFGHRSIRRNTLVDTETVFTLHNLETGAREKTLQFHIRDGRAWAVNFGSRIFQRA